MDVILTERTPKMSNEDYYDAFAREDGAERDAQT